MTKSEIFIKNTRAILKARGIEIQELENYLNLSKGYLSRVISENKRLTLDTAFAISEFLQIPFQDIFEAKKTILEEELLSLHRREQEIEEELKNL